MIRLYNILNEQKADKLNVLFVSDQKGDAHLGYARKLIANNIVTGTVETYRSDDDSSELTNLVYYNISSEYDLVVVYCSGLYDDSDRTIIENLENIITICKRDTIPVVLITIPTTRFIKDQKKSDFRYIDRVNDWISKSSADYIVDLYTIDDDVYFDNTGTHLNKQGQNIIYKQLIDIIGNLDSDIDADAEKKKANAEDGIPFKGSIKNLRALQDKLIALGYEISDIEIENGRYGQSTKDAVRKFQLKNGLISTGRINSKTIDKLQSTPIPASGAKEKIQLTKGENSDAMEIIAFLIDKGLSVAGAAGIAGNMKIESNFKTSILGDHGTSIGLCQWHASRKDELYSWTEQNGYEPLSTEGQLEYLWMELETSYSGLKSKLETTEDPQDAALQFARDFERPSHISSERMKYAQQYFDEYNSGGAIGTLKSIWNGIKTAASIGGAAVSGIVGTEIFGSGAGQLVGNKGGGDNGNWGGSLPKLISILPAGSWPASSQKRGKQYAKGGGVSDHFTGQTDSYACDFSLSGTFKGDTKKATQFAIAVAQNAGKNIDSWKPYVGKYLNINSNGYRVQIIWQSNVGGNHYDHVHVGVRRL